MMRSPFPPGPSIGDRLQTVAAIVGMVVLAFIWVTGIGRPSGDPQPGATPLPASLLEPQRDQFGSPDGEEDTSRFYGPADAVRGLRDIEISEEQVRARWAELIGESAGNIRQPVGDVVAVLEDEGDS